MYASDKMRARFDQYYSAVIFCLIANHITSFSDALETSSSVQYADHHIELVSSYSPITKDMIDCDYDDMPKSGSPPMEIHMQLMGPSKPSKKWPRSYSEPMVIDKMPIFAKMQMHHDIDHHPGKTGGHVEMDHDDTPVGKHWMVDYGEEDHHDDHSHGSKELHHTGGGFGNGMKGGSGYSGGHGKHWFDYNNPEAQVQVWKNVVSYFPSGQKELSKYRSKMVNNGHHDGGDTKGGHHRQMNQWGHRGLSNAPPAPMANYLKTRPGVKGHQQPQKFDHPQQKHQEHAQTKGSHQPARQKFDHPQQKAPTKGGHHHQQHQQQHHGEQHQEKHDHHQQQHHEQAPIKGFNHGSQHQQKQDHSPIKGMDHQIQQHLDQHHEQHQQHQAPVKGRQQHHEPAKGHDLHPPMQKQEHMPAKGLEHPQQPMNDHHAPGKGHDQPQQKHEPAKGGFDQHSQQKQEHHGQQKHNEQHQEQHREQHQEQQHEQHQEQHHEPRQEQDNEQHQEQHQEQHEEPHQEQQHEQHQEQQHHMPTKGFEPQMKHEEQRHETKGGHAPVKGEIEIITQLQDDLHEPKRHGAKTPPGHQSQAKVEPIQHNQIKGDDHDDGGDDEKYQHSIDLMREPKQKSPAQMINQSKGGHSQHHENLNEISQQQHQEPSSKGGHLQSDEEWADARKGSSLDFQVAAVPTPESRVRGSLLQAADFARSLGDRVAPTAVTTTSTTTTSRPSLSTLNDTLISAHARFDKMTGLSNLLNDKHELMAHDPESTPVPFGSRTSGTGRSVQATSSPSSVAPAAAGRALKPIYLGRGHLHPISGGHRTQARLSCDFGDPNQANKMSISGVEWARFSGNYNSDQREPPFECQLNSCRINQVQTDPVVTIHPRPSVQSYANGEAPSYSLTLHEVDGRHLGVYRCSAIRHMDDGRRELVYRIIPYE